jgi:uncharacterized membrane protein YhaH (DUF805 family)
LRSHRQARGRAHARQNVDQRAVARLSNVHSAPFAAASRDVGCGGTSRTRKMHFSNLLFSFQGRINRAKFWLAVLVYIVASIVGSIVAAASGSDIVAGLVNGLVGLLTFLSGLFVAIKRLHDRDKSAGWLLLFYFAPSILAAIGLVLMVLGWAGDAFGMRPVGLLFVLAGLGIALWAFVEMGCLRGTVGPNRYGADPLEPPTGAPPH